MWDRPFEMSKMPFIPLSYVCTLTLLFLLCTSTLHHAPRTHRPSQPIHATMTPASRRAQGPPLVLYAGLSRHPCPRTHRPQTNDPCRYNPNQPTCSRPAATCSTLPLSRHLHRHGVVVRQLPRPPRPRAARDRPPYQTLLRALCRCDLCAGPSPCRLCHRTNRPRSLPTTMAIDS